MKDAAVPDFGPAAATRLTQRRPMQPEQKVHFPDIDAPVRPDLKLVFLARHQSAVRNLRIVNSIPPLGNSRQLSTSLI